MDLMVFNDSIGYIIIYNLMIVNSSQQCHHVITIYKKYNLNIYHTFTSPSPIASRSTQHISLVSHSLSDKYTTVFSHIPPTSFPYHFLSSTPNISHSHVLESVNVGVHSYHQVMNEATVQHHIPSSICDKPQNWLRRVFQPNLRQCQLGIKPNFLLIT